MKLNRILIVLLLLVTAAFASTQTNQGVTVDAPVALATKGPEAGTTKYGKPYTITIYSASLANDDTYMLSVNEYGFQLDPSADPARMTEGFASAKGVEGTIRSRKDVVVAGLPAESAVIDSVQDGRTLRFLVVSTVKGNKGYMFLFGTWMDTTGTDNEAVVKFFKSITIQ